MSEERIVKGSGRLASSARAEVLRYTLRIEGTRLPGWYPGTIVPEEPDTWDNLFRAATPTMMMLENGKIVEISFSTIHPGEPIEVLWRPVKD